MGTLIVVAIVLVLILIFVPLDKIAKAQNSVKDWVKKASDKINK